MARHALVCISSGPSPPACAEQNNGGGQENTDSGSPLAQSAMVCRSVQNVGAAVLGAASSERPPITGTRHNLVSPVRAVAAQSLAPERNRLLASGLSDSVVATIQSARAVSTRSLYTLEWRRFEQWCVARERDPINCALSVILEFLQQLFDEGKAASTLKVYLSAISACHAGITGNSPGSHHA